MAHHNYVVICDECEEEIEHSYGKRHWAMMKHQSETGHSSFTAPGSTDQTPPSTDPRGSMM